MSLITGDEEKKLIKGEAAKNSGGVGTESLNSQEQIVFRIQDAEGRGPWRPGFSHRWVEDRPDHENLIPWFVEFGDVRKIAIFGMAMGSGCRTLEQLRRWFTPSEYRTLLGFGYRAVKMRVGRVLAESDIQCVFERAKPLNQGGQAVELYPANGQVASENMGPQSSQ